MDSSSSITVFTASEVTTYGGSEICILLLLSLKMWLRVFWYTLHSMYVE